MKVVLLLGLMLLSMGCIGKSDCQLFCEGKSKFLPYEGSSGEGEFAGYVDLTLVGSCWCKNYKCKIESGYRSCQSSNTEGFENIEKVKKSDINSK